MRNYQILNCHYTKHNISIFLGQYIQILFPSTNIVILPLSNAISIKDQVLKFLNLDVCIQFRHT